MSDNNIWDCYQYLMSLKMQGKKIEPELIFKLFRTRFIKKSQDWENANKVYDTDDYVELIYKLDRH
jgi:hypothetical protein